MTKWIGWFDSPGSIEEAFQVIGFSMARSLAFPVKRVSPL